VVARAARSATRQRIAGTGPAPPTAAPPGCRIGDRVLIGMGTIILDDTVIEDDVMIGAGSLVPPRKRLESGYLYVSSPVKQVRPLTEKEKEFLKYSSAHYVRLSGQHKQSK